VIMPGSCLLCGGSSPEGPVCTGCIGDLSRTGVVCGRCGSPISTYDLCPQCLRDPPPVDRTVAPLAYGGATRRLVHALKFEGKLPVAVCFGEILAREVATQGGLAVDVLVPVPLHVTRLRGRGFNQAAEIAAAVSGRLGVPQAPQHTCRRHSGKMPQSRIQGRRARRRNVSGVFAVSRGAFLGQRVAVVDDVMTTGSTVYELARAIRKAGAVRVEAWVCSRVGEPRR
jgi:ComF family protein